MVNDITFTAGDIYNMILTNTLDKIRGELADLEAQIEQRFEVLRGKYSDDLIGGMAATFLSEQDLSGLDTEKQILRALADKFLDENGDVKREYKHLEIIPRRSISITKISPYSVAGFKICIARIAL